MKKHLTPLKSVRTKCLDCMGGSPREVKLCSSDDCPIYPYRFGRYPEGARKKRILTDEQKRRLKEQLNKSAKVT